MTPSKYDLGDYKEVKDRIADLRQKYPDGSLSSEVILWPTKDLPFIAVKALCYRTRKDENPGVGLAWEPFPGKTPYTHDSELQNAETSAWGRAIVAALASDTKQGIASADEVRARSAGDAWETARPKQPPGEVGAAPGEPEAPTASGNQAGAGAEGEGRPGPGSTDREAALTEARSVFAPGKADHLADRAILTAAKMQFEVASIDGLSTSDLQTLTARKRELMGAKA